MGTYGYTGAPKKITVGTTGTYDITAYGAQGGSGGGMGAEVGGSVQLTAGEHLELFVGQVGGDGQLVQTPDPDGGIDTNYGGGGGGGGTFVMANTGPNGAYKLLLVAGGGGGGVGGGAGQVGAPGNGGEGTRDRYQQPPDSGFYASKGGYGGAGVKAQRPRPASPYGSNGQGSYAGGQAGSAYAGNGGFGGGGAGSSGFYRPSQGGPPDQMGAGGGGGGGYTGGNGGYAGGNNSNDSPTTGGTSFIAGSVTSPTSVAGENAGDGKVVLSPETMCFCTGTLIRTLRGDIAVEDLVVGDVAVTASDGRRPIKWIGHRTVDCRAHRRPSEAWPVRIAAHAFGAGSPTRDLRLSPGHPVLIGTGPNERLVPIMCLINGTTIERVPVDTVGYWHLELDAHDILLAEGLPAESYIDLGSRPWFEDGADHPLHDPDLVPSGRHGRCRPVALDGPLVEAERRRLGTLFEMTLFTQCGWPSACDLACGF